MQTRVVVRGTRWRGRARRTRWPRRRRPGPNFHDLRDGPSNLFTLVETSIDLNISLHDIDVLLEQRETDSLAFRQLLLELIDIRKRSTIDDRCRLIF